jgi:hypothetical protein
LELRKWSGKSGRDERNLHGKLEEMKGKRWVKKLVGKEIKREKIRSEEFAGRIIQRKKAD